MATKTEVSDISIIDEKRDTQEGTNDKEVPNLLGFAVNLLIYLVIIIVYFWLSGEFLLLCKVAQSNILPTLKECAPYTNTEPKIESLNKQLNIFTKTLKNQHMSAKIEFPFAGDNVKNSFIEWLKKKKDEPSCSFLGLYFISIIENLLHFNYSTINTGFNLLNENLPEMLIVLLGPIIGIIFFIILCIIDWFYFIYSVFSCMSRLFKTRDEKTLEWQNVTLWKPHSFIFRGLIILGLVFFYLFAFTLGSIFTFLFAVFPIPLISFITCFMYSGKMKCKEMNSYTMFVELLKHYKIPLMTIISFISILLSTRQLGTVGGVISMVIIVLMYYGVIIKDSYTPEILTDYSPVASFKQVKKTCPDSNKITKSAGSFLSEFLNSGIDGKQNGGSIARQLKALSGGRK